MAKKKAKKIGRRKRRPPPPPPKPEPEAPALRPNKRRLLYQGLEIIVNASRSLLDDPKASSLHKVRALESLDRAIRHSFPQAKSPTPPKSPGVSGKEPESTALPLDEVMSVLNKCRDNEERREVLATMVEKGEVDAAEADLLLEEIGAKPAEPTPAGEYLP